MLPETRRSTGPFDIAIVGAGPVGLACGIAAKRHGYDAVLIEKGCIADSVFRFPTNMTFFTTPELMEIGNHPLITGPHNKPTRGEALDYYRSVTRVEALDVRTYERVLRLERRDQSFALDVESRDGPKTYEARRVILATGYYDDPNRLDVPGEDLPHVSHYYTEAHPYAGRRVLVVGGKNSAVEAALDLFRHDAHVTLVHRGVHFGKGVKYWILPDIENRIQAGEIRAWFETVVREIREREVELEQHGTTFTERFDQVFLLTGYHPDPDFLRACGLEPDPVTLAVAIDPETCESRDVPDLYLAGSASAGRATGMIFIENGRFDADRILAHIAKTDGREAPASQPTGRGFGALPNGASITRPRGGASGASR
ncbi:MAG TPA: YpdA family putative bacillithiol disulfide reductase [Planctomycetota bacterium]|nr:YpdA family putative bacillithiol disulfide reductase [Planctomycetota bacterium]